MMKYVDIRELGDLHAFRRQLDLSLVTVVLKHGTMKRITIDAVILDQLLKLRDDEQFVQRSQDGSPATWRGIQVIGRAGMGRLVELSSEDGKLRTEFQVT